MHPVLRGLLLDLRAVSHSRKTSWLAMVRESLRIHGSLTVHYHGKSVVLDAAQWERFLTKAGD